MRFKSITSLLTLIKKILALHTLRRTEMFYFQKLKRAIPRRGLSLASRTYLDTRPGNHSLILYCVMLLSGSIATVAKKDTYIPSRRTGKGPLGAKVFSYYTQDERRLVEKAAKLEHRSLSSFVAIAAVERAQRVLGRN